MSEKAKRPERKRLDVTGDYPAIPRVIEQMQRTRGSKFPPVPKDNSEPDDAKPNTGHSANEKIEE